MYFPRTNVGKSERLYWDRSPSATSFLDFFIELPLCPRRTVPGATGPGAPGPYGNAAAFALP
jgi:hypothetical protein